MAVTTVKGEAFFKTPLAAYEDQYDTEKGAKSVGLPGLGEANSDKINKVLSTLPSLTKISSQLSLYFSVSCNILSYNALALASSLYAGTTNEKMGFCFI